LIDGHTILIYYLKWVPTVILAVQSVCFYTWHKQVNYPYDKFCLFLALGFIFCAGGDICLIFPGSIMYICGMIMFMAAYFVFGLARMIKINKQAIKHYTGQIMLGIFLICSTHITFVPVIIVLAFVDRNINVEMIVAICVYSMFINFAITCNYIYLTTKRNFSSLASFLGVLIFAISDCVLIVHDIEYNNKYLETTALTLYWLGMMIIGWSVYYVRTYAYGLLL